MSHDLGDSVAAYALNALPSEEVLIVGAAVRVDPDLQSDYDTHRRVAARLADGFPEVVPAMSPDLWGRIARSAGIQSEAPVGTPAQDTTPVWRRTGSVAFGIAAMLVVAVLAVALLSSRQSAPTQLDLAAAAATEPGAASVSLVAPDSSQAVFSAVLAADGRGYLTAESLPALPGDRTYQLWAIVDDRVISAGVLGSDPDVSQFRVEGNLVGLAVTEEIVGGVAVSENDPVAVWLAEA